MEHRDPTAAEKIIHLIAEVEAEAYQRGWNDAVAKIVATAREGLPAPAVLPPPARAALPNVSQYTTPIIDLVFNIIKERPGLRGSDVVREVMARDSSITRKVADRTGRTSLSRLKKRRRIWQRNSKWYPMPEPTSGMTSSEAKE